MRATANCVLVCQRRPLPAQTTGDLTRSAGKLTPQAACVQGQMTEEQFLERLQARTRLPTGSGSSSARGRSESQSAAAAAGGAGAAPTPRGAGSCPVYALVHVDKDSHHVDESAVKEAMQRLQDVLGRDQARCNLASSKQLYASWTRALCSACMMC